MFISFGLTIKSNELRIEELENVIKMIKEDPSLMEKTRELRLLQTDDERRDYKISNLPYFCLGQFRDNIRRKDHLVEIGGMILDIDAIEGTQLQNLRERIKQDPEVLLCFISPGGRGLKVAVQFDREITIPEEYDQVYRAYATFFSLRHGIEVDTQTSDCSRACFLSADAEIFVNQAPKRINADEWLAIYGQLNNQSAENELTPDPKNNLSSAIEFLIDKNNESGAIYNSYSKWQLLGLSLASLGEDGRAHFFNLSLGNKKYADTKESINAEFDKLLNYYGRTNKRPIGIPYR